MTVERHLVRTPHGYVHVRTAGGGHGLPLVLLHQSPHSSRIFDRLLPHLASGRFVVMPDRLGFGQSDPLPADATFADVAAATLRAVDALGVWAFDVLGILTGSAEAIELASSAPERVRHVILVDVPLLTDDDWADWPSFVREPPSLVADGSHLQTSWDFFAGAARALRPPTAPGFDVALVHEIVVSELGAPTWRSLYPALHEHPVAAQLAALTQPTLVVAPRSSIADQTRRACALIPNARALELDDVDTLELVTERAELLAEHVTAFTGAPCPA